MRIFLPILILLGLIGTVEGNPPAQIGAKTVIAPSNNIVKERRFVEANDYFPQAIAIDANTSGYPHYYSRAADAASNDAIERRFVELETKIKILEKRYDDLLRMIPKLGGVGGGDGPITPVDDIDEKMFAVLNNNSCKQCHNKTDADGELVLFNDDDSLWVRKVEDGKYRELTNKELNKFSRVVETGVMPKGKAPVNQEGRDIVYDWVQKHITEKEVK